MEIKKYEKYLGLPTVVGRNKKVSFNNIKDGVWGKVQGWKEKFITFSNRERSFIESSGSSNPHFCYELLQATS